MSNPQQIQAYLLPALAEPEHLRGQTVVVIDVLRATTTIIHALAAGAVQVVPCLEVEEARRMAEQLAGPAVLGGERAGGKIAGFDLGNSPLEYTTEAVGGKTLVFTTTNGTRAMTRCRAAKRVLLGAFVNLSAVCRELSAVDQIALVCAGTNGHVTREDALFAGAVVSELARTARPSASGEYRSASAARPSASGGRVAGRQEPPEATLVPILNDQAEIVRDAWHAATADLIADPLNRTLRSTRGGRNLIGIGHENDIDLAAQIDRFDLVPELDLATWTIRVP